MIGFELSALEIAADLLMQDENEDTAYLWPALERLDALAKQVVQKTKTHGQNEGLNDVFMDFLLENGVLLDSRRGHRFEDTYWPEHWYELNADEAGRERMFYYMRTVDWAKGWCRGNRDIVRTVVQRMKGVDSEQWRRPKRPKNSRAMRPPPTP